MKRPAIPVVLVSIAALGIVLVLAGAAEGLTIKGFFSDDNGHLFEEDIDAIAQAGITKGCNPPANNRYCPDRDVDRGAMAAFLRRALGLPNSSTDHFIDDNNSIFEADINAIAQAGITKGCNPPANNRYCPNDTVDRGAMAAFLRRALNLPSLVMTIPMSNHGSLTCDKDGTRCTLTVDVVSGRNYRVEEGLFQVLPASGSELGEFNGANTRFSLSVNGSAQSANELPTTTETGVSIRTWRGNFVFTSGNHSMIGRWRWDGAVVHTAVITVRANA